MCPSMNIKDKDRNAIPNTSKPDKRSDDESPLTLIIMEWASACLRMAAQAKTQGGIIHVVTTVVTKANESKQSNNWD